MTICCDVTCPRRMECAKFQRALDVNAGKSRVYDIVQCERLSEYER